MKIQVTYEIKTNYGWKRNNEMFTSWEAARRFWNDLAKFGFKQVDVKVIE